MQAIIIIMVKVSAKTLPKHCNFIKNLAIYPMLMAVIMRAFIMKWDKV